MDPFISSEPEEIQQEEIIALKAVHGENFIESPPPKAWKAAARLIEYGIIVTHTNPQYAEAVSFHLHVKYPKTYPLKSSAQFDIRPPINGLSSGHVEQLKKIISEEVRNFQREQMVAKVVGRCQDWIEENVTVQTGSLANQLELRTLQKTKAFEEQQKARREEDQEKARIAAEDFKRQVDEDERKGKELLRLEQKESKSRKRALSDVTERPLFAFETLTFDNVIELQAIRFDTVKLFHARKECLGTTYSAEPVTEGWPETMFMDLHVIKFEALFYATKPGRKKLRSVEEEIKLLINTNNEHVSKFYAVQLKLEDPGKASQLSILVDKEPALSLHALLDECDRLREERASDYLYQILIGLNAIHATGLVHRGLNTRTIGLVDKGNGDKGKTVKLTKTSFYARLQDFNRSDPLGPDSLTAENDVSLPNAWAFREGSGRESATSLARYKDLHDVGIIVLQMTMGLSVMERFTDPNDALFHSNLSDGMQVIISQMLDPSKGPKCQNLLSILSKIPVSSPIKIRDDFIGDMTTVGPRRAVSRSPEKRTFFPPDPPNRSRQVSRWEQEWDEKEVLGKGGFGSVIRARNKLDTRRYAIKKIKLQSHRDNSKIFREVSVLSKLSHDFIVRYYGAWVEETDVPGDRDFSGSSDESDEEKSEQSPAPFSNEDSLSRDPLSIDLAELESGPSEALEFPNILFTSGDTAGDTDGSDAESSENEFPYWEQQRVRGPPRKRTKRTLYIQMEYVENSTLLEKIQAGISEDEAWRLFQQLLRALAHMANLGILHRDIKLTNIFIDSRGNCKIGDFGLATSSHAESDRTLSALEQSTASTIDLTLEVGTRLYIAPEVLSRRRGPRDHSKADMYSLGIVFFEMNYMFNTASERIFVVENLRKPEIIFPSDWDASRRKQREVITRLLQHDPSDRPTAEQIQGSGLLPLSVEEEHYNDTLKKLANPESSYFQNVITTLFKNSASVSRGFLYDSNFPESTSQKSNVINRLEEVFRLHGAREYDLPLLTPRARVIEENTDDVLLLDRHGGVLMLTNEAIVSFARLAARIHSTRSKRFRTLDTFRKSTPLEHPKSTPTAIFDIITPDIENGPTVSAAELILITKDCLALFPGLDQYEILVSHSKIFEIVFNRMDAKLQPMIIDIFSHPKNSVVFRRQNLQKLGLMKSTLDELEALYDIYSDWDVMRSRLEKTSPTLWSALEPYIREMGRVYELARLSEVPQEVYFRPLMVGKRRTYFNDGVCFEVARKEKRSEVLAVCGRYDKLISKFLPPAAKEEPICAYVLQIAIDRITSSIAQYQATTLAKLKHEKSFGYWSVRRCDVYVVSFEPGHLEERLEVVTLLWKHDIHADLAYEKGIESLSRNYVSQCAKEGILFTVNPINKSGKREFKIKSILRGTEHIVSRQDLVPWLKQQIGEQNRIDQTLSGVEVVPDGPVSPVIRKEAAFASNMHLFMPGDSKKQRKQTKNIIMDKVQEKFDELKTSLQSGGVPVLAVDVSPVVFESLLKNYNWLRDDDSWRSILAQIPAQHVPMAHQVREAASKKKDEGAGFVLLYSVKEDRLGLLNFDDRN